METVSGTEKEEYTQEQLARFEKLSTRRCPRCKVVKPWEEFNTNGQCKPCFRIRRQELYAKESETVREARREYGRQWYRANPEKTKLKDRKQLLKRHGLSLESFDKMVLTQEGCCAICKKEAKLLVDHEHITGKVRALLCISCNWLIGYSKEDLAILLAAADYIFRHKLGVTK